MRKECTWSLLVIGLVGCAGGDEARLEPINAGLNALASDQAEPSEIARDLPDPGTATEAADPWVEAAINLQELLAMDGSEAESPEDPGPDADSSLDALAQADLEISEPAPERPVESLSADELLGEATSGQAEAAPDELAADEPTTDESVTEEATPGEEPPALATAAPTPEQIARELHRMLLERAAAGDTAETARAALLAAALDLPDEELEALDLHPSERARIDAARAFARSITRENATNEQILGQLEAMADEMVASSSAFRVREAKLCTEVRAFGDYTPIENVALLAGEPHRLIVYSEPDRFACRETVSNGHTFYRVEISQELTLYHDGPGELQVWHQPRARITENSRRKRRDFYLVNEIELPARLSVGAYLLKVSTRDEVSGAIAERSIPIRIVADPALASAGG